MRFFVTALILGANSWAQTLSYSPSQILEKTVSLNYYSTEYIFITNNSGQQLNLGFELIDAVVPQQWSVTGCTNMICYTNLPDSGPLGAIQNAGQAYLSVNLAVNETAGDAIIQFAVFDETNPQQRDTILFKYHAGEDSLATKPQPWAKINFAQNVITVFVLNETVSTTLEVFDLQAKRVVAMKLEAITAVSLADFPDGIYVVVVRDSNGRRLAQKIVKW
jgi:hypothetical protein